MKKSILHAVLLFLTVLLSVSCSRRGVYYPDLSPPPPDDSLPFEAVYTDELVPEGYVPLRDDVVLYFDIGDVGTYYLVNPYSARVTLLCRDPLCSHDNMAFDCPLYFYAQDWNAGPEFWNGELFYCGGDTGLIEYYDGSPYKIVQTVGFNGFGIVRYRPDTLEKGILLHAEDRADGKRRVESITVYENSLYYKDWVVTEDGGKKQHLCRMDLESEMTEDLGEYLGYTNIIVNAGYIWNYYGFLNPNDSPLWERNADYWIRCDLDNRNPERIPVRHELCGDLEGYVLPREIPEVILAMRYLLYMGDRDEPHVVEFDRQLFSWTNGTALEFDAADNGMGDLFLHDYRTGEEKQMLAGWEPDDADRTPTYSSIVDGRFVFFAMHDPPRGRNSSGRIRYYIRADLETGETVRVLPPRG